MIGSSTVGSRWQCPEGPRAGAGNGQPRVGRGRFHVGPRNHSLMGCGCLCPRGHHSSCLPASKCLAPLQCVKELGKG